MIHPNQAAQLDCTPAQDTSTNRERAEALPRSLFGHRVLGHAALIVAVLLGAGLRLFWVDDMEYKGDEQWTFERTQEVGRSEPFPWLGMPTSYEIRHPGGTVWVFVALARAFGIHEPTALARACQMLNVAAILLLLGFCFWALRGSEREPWLWATALVSLNPLAVVLHRKIWPPSVAPFFTMLLLVCWWYRQRRWGAFCWGVAGMILGQIHPAGLFFAAAFALWALLFDRRNVAWLHWLGGSILGALPLIPWLHYVLLEMSTGTISQRRWSHLFEMRYWFRWLSEPFGISVEYALGEDFVDYLRYPLVGGQPTYLVGVLHGVIGVATIACLTWLGASLWKYRGRWKDLWIGRDSPTAFTQNAALWGFGLVFTATRLPIHRHYMVLTFPLMFLWLARVALAQRRPLAGPFTLGRATLLTLCIVQGLVSASFLHYVHVNRYRIQGEYGVPYGVQQRELSQTAPATPLVLRPTTDLADGEPTR